jgi:hypothetical protein
MFMDSEDMRAFDQALRGLIAKAQERGFHLSPAEITRRMLIVQEANGYDPKDFDDLVLADNFSESEPERSDNLQQQRLIELARALATVERPFDSRKRRGLSSRPLRSNRH